MRADALVDFAAEVGAEDPVVAVGGRTQWELGGGPHSGAREVRPPAGIVDYDPAEMVVRVRAGTTVAELHDRLADHGQETALDAMAPDRATVGGVLAAGQSGLRRLRIGPVRDALLEVRFITADGTLAKGGGPVVKNVTGFDVCRLLVGSLGTLGIMAEVVLRCLPVPPVQRWLRAPTDPFATRLLLHRPSALLWDGASTWVLLEGDGGDVDAQTGALGPAWEEVAGPPTLPPHRHVVDPATLALLAPTSRAASDPASDHASTPGPSAEGAVGAFVAEVGVGTVHRAFPQPARTVAEPVRVLNERIKSLFDPAGRLAPGRSVL